MSIKEYRKLSLEFRRYSSNLFKTTRIDGNVPIVRFKKFIDENDVIKNIIDKKIKDIDYDYTNFVDISINGWKELNIPVDESEHIKAMYDFMTHIVDENVSVENLGFMFLCGSKNINDCIQNFLSITFKPLTDFITDEISNLIIENEEDNMSNYNFQNNTGVVNITGNDSNINSNNTINNNNLSEIKDLIKEIRLGLNNIDISKDEKEDIIDDIDCMEEQLDCSIEKPQRLRKVFNNIKDFMSNASLLTGSGVAVATNIQKLLDYIKPIIDSFN